MPGGLLRGGKRRLVLSELRRFDRSGLFFDQFDEVVDDIGVLQPVVGDPAEIDLVRAVAAASFSRASVRASSGVSVPTLPIASRRVRPSPVRYWTM